jgi:hypothetical protein
MQNIADAANNDRRVAHPFPCDLFQNVGAPPFALFEGWEEGVSNPYSGFKMKFNSRPRAS